MTNYPYEALHPFTDLILKQLQQVLDDRKRFVRRLAVKVRNQWAIL